MTLIDASSYAVSVNFDPFFYLAFCSFVPPSSTLPLMPSKGEESQQLQEAFLMQSDLIPQGHAHLASFRRKKARDDLYLVALSV